MLRQLIISTSLAMSVQAVQAEPVQQDQQGHQPTPPLTLKVYNADAHSFNANSTLVMGDKEAVVIDWQREGPCEFQLRYPPQSRLHE